MGPVLLLFCLLLVPASGSPSAVLFSDDLVTLGSTGRAFLYAGFGFGRAVVGSRAAGADDFLCLCDFLGLDQSTSLLDSGCTFQGGFGFGCGFCFGFGFSSAFCAITC